MRTWVKLSKVSWLAVAIVASAFLMSTLAVPAGATLHQFDMDSDQNHSGVFYTKTGFTSVKVTTLFSDTLVYGWVTSPAGIGAPTGQRDRGAISGDPQSNLDRDFHFDSVERTFKTAYGSGTYNVTLYFRDTGYVHDNIQVYAENALVVPAFTTSLTTTITKTFNTVVTDGALDLRFHDAGGSDPNWVINGISINYVPLPSTVLLLGSGLVGLGLLRRKRSLKK